VVTGADGVAEFDALQRRQKAADAMLYAFDPWSSTARICGCCRSATARPSLRGCRAGIAFNEHTDEDGAVVFQHASALDRSLAASDQECFRRLKR
jgi:hypothetical protein